MERMVCIMQEKCKGVVACAGIGERRESIEGRGFA
jgi:hypothetical protein